MLLAHRLNVLAGLAQVAAAVFLVLVEYWAVNSSGALSIGEPLADFILERLVSLIGGVGILDAAKPAIDDHVFGHTSIGVQLPADWQSWSSALSFAGLAEPN